MKYINVLKGIIRLEEVKNMDAAHELLLEVLHSDETLKQARAAFRHFQEYNQ